MLRNYEYILASLPVITSGTRSGVPFEQIVSEIRENLSGKDLECFELLLEGFEGENLSAEFYLRAFASRSRFIREYFRFDLGVRNVRVGFLNRELGRPEALDKVFPDPESPEEFEQQGAVLDVLSRTDILERERGLDDLMWEKIESLTELEVLSLDQILGFTAKLQIIKRWLQLDPETGRALFERLVSEIRNNKKPLSEALQG